MKFHVLFQQIFITLKTKRIIIRIVKIEVESQTLCGLCSRYQRMLRAEYKDVSLQERQVHQHARLI